MKGISIPAPRTVQWRGYVLPGLATGAALTAAVVGGLLTGDSASTEGINGIIETLSGRSASYLGNVRLLAPLGIAFAAGMAATVNPCGFPMLPAYLGLYMGARDADGPQGGPIQRLAKALLVTGVVTSGFVLLFGIAGLVIGAGARSIIQLIPWLGLSIGVLVAVAGSWLLGGGELYTALAGRAASHIGDPGRVGIRGYFLFGLSYATASLGCTLPIFLAVVVSTQAVSGTVVAVGQFLLYAMGMGLVILVLTVGMTVFKGAVVGALRKAMPYIQPLSAALMIVAGSYIVYYWLTLGDLA